MQLWEYDIAIRLSSFMAHSLRKGNMGRDHDHAFFELGVVMEGGCYWVLNRRQKLFLKKGDFILLAPKTIHREEGAEGPTRLAFVGFDLRHPEDLAEGPHWANRSFASGDSEAEIGRLLHQIYQEHHSHALGATAHVEFCLKQLLIQLTRKAEAHHPEAPTGTVMGETDLSLHQINVVRSAAHYLRSNLKQPLQISQVARYYSFSPAYFSTLFRNYYGMSPNHYLQRARVEKAAQLLKESDLAIKQIAAHTGFVDSAHFCKQFKRAYRQTPKNYRRKAAR